MAKAHKNLKIKDVKSDKAFEKGIEKLRKAFGPEIVNTLSANLKRNGTQKVKWIKSGCVGFDQMTGGGFPRGRIVELFGGESSGKTTLLLTTIASSQKKGLRCGFVDAEHSLDPKYVMKLGVDMDKLVYVAPLHGEQALEATRTLVEMNLDFIVVDSVAALVPKAELEAEMEADTMGLQARMLGKALRKIKGEVKKSVSSVVFINQTRDKFNVRFGDKTTTPGGKALKFFAELRIQLTHMGKIRESKVHTANRTKVLVKKTKVGFQGSQCEFVINFGKGIDKLLSLWETLHVLELAESHTKNGKKRIYVADAKFIDYDDFCDRMKSDKDLKRSLMKMIRKHGN